MMALLVLRGGGSWKCLFFLFLFFRSNTGARAGLVIEGVSIRRRAFFRGAKIASLISGEYSPNLDNPLPPLPVPSF
ncbi:uncharacterized protein ASPGLDRAFT_664961 [Aspergillus glaucus CBS 516.65]|uniref:Secreted protein n=1 Tax=Aspergillus glaucus CBS 516.65 TaxID=1160497 RepID=A0A1L9VBW5_ASPGL|nr:hypothetical protein ASPGLDRAFT_664961 [Aspergillus glaucus CBS 516.65]OJJ81375.1 hypothetical protein ASPGLDRAFT_664961 [Aspergillus glaucus CBS 516.65]